MLEPGSSGNCPQKQQEPANGGKRRKHRQTRGAQRTQERAPTFGRQSRLEHRADRHALAVQQILEHERYHMIAPQQQAHGVSNNTSEAARYACIRACPTHHAADTTNSGTNTQANAERSPGWQMASTAWPIEWPKLSTARRPASFASSLTIYTTITEQIRMKTELSATGL